MWRVVISLMLALSGWAQESHPILPLGSPAPNFELPGVDGTRPATTTAAFKADH
jgi:hypothetical protein